MSSEARRASPKRGMCRDCGKRFAQELGRCRRCWNLRIEGKSERPNAFRPEQKARKRANAD